MIVGVEVIVEVGLGVFVTACVGVGVGVLGEFPQAEAKMPNINALIKTDNKYLRFIVPLCTLIVVDSRQLTPDSVHAE